MKGQLYLCVDCKNYQPSQTNARIESAKRARVALMKTVETGLNQIIQVNDGNWMTSVAYQDQFWFRTANFHKSNVAEALLFLHSMEPLLKSNCPISI